MKPLLDVQAVHAHYGRSHVLQHVDLHVDANEIVALFGRNGVGKTTLIHTIMGIVRPTAGSVIFDGVELAGMASHRIARLGVALVPQGRRIFSTLSVDENLRIAERNDLGSWTVESVYEFFPSLAKRRRARGGHLSGGEQQMLAIGRALVCNPKIVLLDEPSEGLAPMIVQEITRVLSQIRSMGIPSLLVEQNPGVALGVADRVYVMDRGHVVHESDAGALSRDPTALRELLGVS